MTEYTMSRIPKPSLYSDVISKGKCFMKIIINPKTKYKIKNNIPITRRNRCLGDFS